MELLINFFTEYRKAITTFIVGVILYFGKNNLPELFSPEVVQMIEIGIGAIIVGLIGHWTRLSSSQAEVLNEIEKK